MEKIHPHEYRIKIEDEEMSLVRQINPKDTLEVFSGDGKNAVFFADHGMKVTGIESDQRFIKTAIEKSDKVNWVNHPVYYEKFPFENESFDFIYSYQYLNHNYKEEIVRVFKEIYRTLRKGGIFSIKISDIEQFNLVHKRDRIYKEGDPEHRQIRYMKLAPQTFAKIEQHEIWIPHYAFYKYELVKTLENVGFKLINIRKIRWNLVGNFKK